MMAADFLREPSSSHFFRQFQSVNQKPSMEDVEVNMLSIQLGNTVFKN